MSENGGNGSDGDDDRDGGDDREEGDADRRAGEENDRQTDEARNRDREKEPPECDDRPDRADSSAERPAGSVTLSLDATLELLANHDRRIVLSYLREASDRTATVDELADYLVERHTVRTGERPGRSHVRSTLHHIHVPKLVDAGVVDYDPRTEEVRYWGSERLETWHERIERDEN